MKKLMLLLAVMVLAAAICAAQEVPIGSDRITQEDNQKFDASVYQPKAHSAQAGNVTNISLFGKSPTRHWQGYFGEVTGIITLDDASNWTMYDWPNMEPKGEVYAVCNTSGASPDWSTVECFDYDANLDRWHMYYNMTWDAVDNINSTFNISDHPDFSVGMYSIDQDTCPSQFTYVDDAYQNQEFREILLQTDGYQLVYTEIIENDNWFNDTDPMGFNGNTVDFQMLVGEDGSSRSGATLNTAATTYYFYLDLE